ncbi:hypothetical protein OIU74_023576 [Salix koriyanagi]|uniref:Uncharacterized protein n=1 Tax=Salix koriyanagi TaxID=2511006 RepID=A0A9Q0WFK3_9ROSI|nr:hypothetical protein OIU74_023576 [Salix koriyanagi]
MVMVQKQEDERREEEHKQMPEDLSQVPKKRFHFSRSPEKSIKSGSSVIPIKTIPTSSKSGKNITKNRLKDTQRKNKT